MAELSTQDVFGGGAGPQASSSGEMSAADVFGTTPAQKSPVQDLKRGARNVAQAADLVLGLPGQALAAGADIGGRINALAHGGSRSDAEWAGKATSQMVPEILTNPVTKLMKLAGFTDDYESSDVEQVMGRATSLLAQGGEWVEKVTKGAITKDDTVQLTNLALLGLGTRGASAVADPKLKAMGEVKRPVNPDEVQAANPQPQPQQPPPRPPIQDVQGRINSMLNIQDPKTLAKEQMARRQEVRAAFKEDPAYANYLKNYANEEIKLRAQATRKLQDTERDARVNAPIEPKTRLPEGQSLDGPAAPPPARPIATDAPSTLDSALTKLRGGKGFDLTAEERVAVRGATSQWGTPQLLDSEGKLLPPASQRGSVDYKLLAGLAAIGLGAMAGKYLDEDNPVEGALIGTFAGAAATRISPTGVKNVLSRTTPRDLLFTAGGAAAGAYLNDSNRGVGAALGGALAGALRALPKDQRIRIEGEANARDYVEKSYNLKVSQFQHALIDAVPDQARAEEVVKWAESRGQSQTQLSPTELKTAKALTKFLQEVDTRASLAKAIDAGRQVYQNRLQANPSANGASRLGMYVNAMSKAMADGEMIRALESTPIGAPGQTLVMTMKKAPRGYVQIQNPLMGGRMVHPDLEGPMKFMLEAPTPGAAMKAIETVNSGMKRVAVMGSLFHAKSLLDAAVGAVKMNKAWAAGGAAAGAAYASSQGQDPVIGAMIGAGAGMFGAVGKTGVKAVAGYHPILEQLRQIGGSPMIDRALKGGLEFSVEHAPSVVDDMGGGSFYQGMEKAADFLNKTVPHAGKPIEGLIKVNQVFDKLMWARLHTTLKLTTFDEKFNQLKEANARANAKDPNKVALLSEAELAHAAAAFTNDTFGGLNWRRIAEGTQSRWGRDLALNALSPTGRRVMQLVMFAPDWTLSTTRAFTGAFGEGGGLKGLMDPRTQADLHRQYLLRGAFYYAMAGDGLNYALSGHHLWDKKDWTRIDLGDGRTMQFSKHMMEPFHWIINPGQQALNKLSQPIKEGASQALGVEYLSTKGRMPPMKNRLEHLKNSVSPITEQQSEKGGSPAAAISSFVGAPIYGKTKEQKAQDARSRERERELARRKKERESRE